MTCKSDGYRTGYTKQSELPGYEQGTVGFNTILSNSMVFAENLIELGFLQSLSYIKQIPTHKKIFAVGKSGPNAAFNLVFLG